MNIGDLHNHQMFGMGLFKVGVYCHPWAKHHGGSSQLLGKIPEVNETFNGKIICK